jgi:hypothetical protein
MFAVPRPGAVLVLTLAACSSRGGSASDAGAGGSTAGTGTGGASTGAGGTTADAGSDARGAGGGGGGADANRTRTYDDTVLADHPVGYWTLAGGAATEPDLSGHGNPGTYQGGAPAAATMPNGDRGADFDGAKQFLTIPSSSSYSIPTTGSLTWEGWIRPDVLQFPNDGGGGYVDWMGKCAEYSPTCEWEGRFYSTTNSEGRCNRLSAYVFNPSAGLGSGADFQPDCGLFQPAVWYHVVGEYTTLSQPAACMNATTFPGSINIWVNGVPWNQSRHGQTGCMSQFSVAPKANGSPINIGTMAKDTWFPGAVGKVAIYDYLLTPTQISTHFETMRGVAPSGSCSDTCTIPVM